MEISSESRYFNQINIMTTVILFDIDSTLTPPRQPITKEMVEVLMRLSVPFHVAAGSHIALVQGQFLTPLYNYGYRGQFEAFLSNGAIHYSCDYSNGMSVKVVSEFSLREYLGERDYGLIITALKRILRLKKFKLGAKLRVIGKRITDRGSMINFCPIGRVTVEDAEVSRNRVNFVEYDRAHGYRKMVIDHLNHELARLLDTRHLSIALGGQTSFDIGVSMHDKSTALRTLLKSDSICHIIFVGDALFEGGNDEPVLTFIEKWDSEAPCPVEAVQVESWRDTITKLHARGFVNSSTY
jgi:phosphomannomutase